MIGKHRDLAVLSDHITYYQLSLGIKTYCLIRAQKVIDIFPKVTYCSFTVMQQYIATKHCESY